MQKKLQPFTTDLHTHLAQELKKLEGVIKVKLQNSEYKCDMIQCIVLYTTTLLSVKNMAAALLLPSKFVQISLVANMKIKPYSTGNFGNRFQPG